MNQHMRPEPVPFIDIAAQRLVLTIEHEAVDDCFGNLQLRFSRRTHAIPVVTQIAR